MQQTLKLASTAFIDQLAQATDYRTLTVTHCMRLISLAFQPSAQSEFDHPEPPQDHAFSLSKFEDTHKKAREMLSELRTHLHVL